MKNVVRKIFLTMLYMHSITAGNIAVINSTSSQISITIQTTTNTTTTPVFPHENQNLNDINNPAPTPTMITYNGDPIQKIIITRLSTNMPQVIYYNAGIDDHGSIAAIYRTKNGTMHVWPNYIDINNIAYPLKDLSSYIVRCNQLRINLSPTNLDSTQKEIDDLAAAITLVNESDMADEIGSQINIIQAGINVVSNNIQIMTTFNKNLKTIQDLQKNLTNDNFKQTEQTLHDMQEGLQTIAQAGLAGALYNQAQALQNSFIKLQAAIEQFLGRQQNYGTSGTIVML